MIRSRKMSGGLAVVAVLVAQVATGTAVGGATATGCPRGSTAAADVVVESVDSHRVTDESFPYAIETITHARVVDIVAGGLEGTRVRIWQPGGVVSESEWSQAADALSLAEGQRAVVCLTPAHDAVLRARSAFDSSDEPLYFADEPAGVDIPHLHHFPTAPEHGGVQAPGDEGYVEVQAQRAPWSLQPMGFRINPENNDGVPRGDATIAVALGSLPWGAYSWVNFRQEGTTSIRQVDPLDDVRVVFFSTVNDDPFCTDHSARAHIQGKGRWDIAMNDNCFFNEEQIEAVATHEFGHALGLGHTTVDGNVMCVAAEKKCAHRPPAGSLGPGDIRGVRALYPYNDYRASTNTTYPVDFGIHWQYQERDVDLTFANPGRTPWGAFRKVRFTKVDDGCSRFASGSWVDDCRTIAELGVVTDEYGQTVVRATFFATFDTPPGTYEERYRLYADTIGFFGPVVTFTFQKPVGMPSTRACFSCIGPLVG